MKIFNKLFQGGIRVIKGNTVILFMILLTLSGISVLSVFVIIPAYTSNSNQLYSSALGAPAMQRKVGEPLSVVVSRSEYLHFRENVLGEGLCASKPILVPIVPMAPVVKVFVEEGEEVKAGQLLVELDDSKARIKYESALLAVSTATAELARVRLGSAYVLAQERPEVEKINVVSVKEQYEATNEKFSRFQKAYERGVISKVRLLEVRNEQTLAQEKLSKAELAMKMAELGVLQSERIAENAVDDAGKALAHRSRELKSYKVYAPTAGVIDRVLVNAGEYNQDSGKPGFVIASGLWFEAYFDQSDFSKVHVGQDATISLESYSGRKIKAKVVQVKPIVSFQSGGPEISRPVRPRGSGSPEWAATFKVKLMIKDRSVKIAPGMTGFARIEYNKNGLAVPRSSVSSVSAGKAIVYVADGGDSWTAREVGVGRVDGLKVEVLDGLMAGEKVIVDGHWGLKQDDIIKVVAER